MRPRIGITTSTLERATEGSSHISSATHLTYSRCIYAAGGLPLLLPNVLAEEDLDALLATLDGVMLSGGGDIDSRYWGEALHPAVGLVDPTRDAFELALARAALRRDLPMLGICRGVQVLAVATGGDLWQDIPTQCPDNIGHRQSSLRHEPQHTVTITADSLLAHLLWPAGAVNVTKMNLAVNSFHHQAPRNYGTMLTPVAISPDGLLEGLEAPAATFVLGVQWHPEEMVEVAPLQAHLFSGLVATARTGRRN
jgi:putative glutamine amidotransferase